LAKSDLIVIGAQCKIAQYSLNYFFF